MTRTKVKICGITRIEDAVTAALHGADAIGLVFYSKSPRYIKAETASKIIAELPPFISKVGLFVNASENEIIDLLGKVPLDLLQFHGEETAEQCSKYSIPYIKAIRMVNGVDLKHEAEQYSTASALLLDTYVEGKQGGTGKTFDWSIIPDDIKKPIILAGGLTSLNVAEAIRQVSPYAVDVSGGVESEKGIKNEAKIIEFMREVNNAQS